MIRVLMVDDDPAVLEITKVFLERSGDIEVDAVVSALEATERLQDGGYDVIVSDYVMPEMDGISFLKQVRCRGSEIPFILFTGKGREEVVIEALNNGADYYLQKDANPKEGGDRERGEVSGPLREYERRARPLRVRPGR